MCTHPLAIRRSYGNQTKVDVVPCGKCHECISKKQNEFAALACLQAKKSSSMWFFTLTYRNDTCPIMRSYISSTTGEVFTSFLDERERSNVVSEMALNLDGSKELNPFYDGIYEFNASLRREDLKLFIKRVRLAYQRKFNDKLDFTYAAFGEYGDNTNRPHYHALFFGLTDKQASFISSKWSEDFGFTTCYKIPVLNPDGSPAHVKVSKYVSKYLSKPKKDFQPLMDGKVEAPRRVSSKAFGLGVVEDKLRDFIYAKI